MCFSVHLCRKRPDINSVVHLTPAARNCAADPKRYQSMNMNEDDPVSLNFIPVLGRNILPSDILTMRNCSVLTRYKPFKTGVWTVTGRFSTATGIRYVYCKASVIPDNASGYPFEYDWFIFFYVITTHFYSDLILCVLLVISSLASWCIL